jgi:hypothetical protein
LPSRLVLATVVHGKGGEMMFHLPNAHVGSHPSRARHAQWSAREVAATSGTSFCDACGSVCDDGCRREASRAQRDHLLLRAGLGQR